MIAIDVSSHQKPDLTSYIVEFNPDVVIVKCYLPEELIPQSYTVAQAYSAAQHGKEVWGYFWGYASLDPRKSARDAYALLKQIGGKRLWLDVEPYHDSDTETVTIPSVEWIRQAIDEGQRTGITIGIYTGKWVWDIYFSGVTEFSHLPLWAAVYDGPFVPFGGWTEPEGIQWTSTPIDQNIFKDGIMPRTQQQQFIINVLKVNMEQRSEEIRADLLKALERLGVLDNEVTEMATRLEREFPQ